MTTDTPQKVLVIGAAGLDMVGRIEGEPETGTSVPANIRVAWGGVARNVAENLARLGEAVSLVSVVGEDFAGDALLRTLVEAGVETAHVRRIRGVSTGAYLAVVNPHGELRLAMDDMRAMEALDEEWLEQQAVLFEDCAMVFLDANLSAHAIGAVLRLAHRQRIPVAADPVSRTLALRLKPHLRELALVTPNAREAGVLLGCELDPHAPDDAVMAARNLVAAGAQCALISLDEMGVAYADADGGGHIPALRTPIIDPTGAIDALIAAVLFGRLNEIPLDESVRLGVAAAALTLRSAHTVVPDLTVEKLYAELM
jgi:pseudouridine kinase